MKKLFCFILSSLALTGFLPPVQAHFGVSIRGDVGMLGNQLPYFILQTGNAPVTEVNTTTHFTPQKEWQWDFMGRVFMYTSCVPCSTYVAASWQGSHYKTHSCEEVVVNGEEGLRILLPLRAVTERNIITAEALTFISSGSPVSTKIELKNKFSKAKLGLGFDLIKKKGFLFTMEVGGNYLDAQLQSNQNIIITQTAEQGPGCIFVAPGVPMCSPGFEGLPFDFVINFDTCQKTEGVGIYVNIKTEYKLPATCLGNCFSIYAKAEVADIIGHQKYNNRLSYVDQFDFGSNPIIPPRVFDYEECVSNGYNNIVEVDLEAALVYSPYFNCWENLRPNFVLGVRTDSFVNLFFKPVKFTDASYLSLSRPTLFCEVSFKL